MSLMATEGKHPLEPSRRSFPKKKLNALLLKLVSAESKNFTRIVKFQEYLQYDDVLFHTWNSLMTLSAIANPSHAYIRNYLKILDKMRVEANEDSSCLVDSETKPFKYNETRVKQCVNKIWNSMLSWKHNESTHKQLLIILLERIIPHLNKPLLLTDFLMDSLDVGGPVSLLALQGIFTLIQKYNLDYPNIYTKLYSMFEPEIFHTKFKARLFYLSNIFLSSTHLPESIVAGFAKRLARLALVAPPTDIVVICMFIGNLILRHPGLKRLLHDPTSASVTSDPYVFEEPDPAQSRAIESSLWEIQTLQHHVLPNVARAASFINQPLPSTEWDLGPALDASSDDVFHREMKKREKSMEFAYERESCDSFFRSRPACWNL